MIIEAHKPGTRIRIHEGDRRWTATVIEHDTLMRNMRLAVDMPGTQKPHIAVYDAITVEFDVISTPNLD